MRQNACFSCFKTFSRNSDVVFLSHFSFSQMALLLRPVLMMPHADCLTFVQTKKLECIPTITSSVVLHLLPSQKVADFYWVVMMTLTVMFGIHLNKTEQVSCVQFLT